MIDCLGFTVGLDTEEEWGSIRAYRSGEHGLYIQHNKDAEYKEFVRTPGLDHLCIKVENRDKVNQAHTLVQSLGVKVTIPPKEFPEYTPTYYALNFRDPDGVPLEIATY